MNKIEEMTLTIAKYQSLIEQRDANIREMQDNLRLVIRENKHLQETVEQVSRERDAAQRNLQDATDLSNRRGNELAGAQTFLSKADTISSAEVQQKLAALNE